MPKDRKLSNFNLAVKRGAAVDADIQATAGSIGLTELSSGVAPAYIVVFAGEVTTSGGDATETETVTGALASDIVFANVQTEGATPRTLDAVAVTADTVTATFSGDPSTDHVWSYMILRAAS